ncbi:DUF4890 domain-containing protein [Pedobacter changchengzhani]|uniref:DUF4890 domain-containing protein n=1 Tax=Pedobacter changchengzhani TaxID=2529274 RepID=A0A4R5MHJ4_9SPHI|nr:DUF4890 domain-containing protein [Pedobacter changchengzhani]TDG34994.1 DUF4890 domain-containing protein [Pedobacter changchengzhani]
MRKVILTMAIAVMGFTAAFAQDASKRKMDMQKFTPEQRAERSTAMLDKKLSLSADQKTKIYQINLDRANKVEAMRNTAEDGKKGRGKQMKADMDASNNQLEMVLTPAQKIKYDAWKAEMKDKKRNGGRRGSGYSKKDMKPVVSNPPAQG